MEKFWLDIFENGRFKATIYLLFPKNWIFSEEDITNGIIDKYPSLRNANWSLKCT